MLLAEGVFEGGSGGGKFFVSSLEATFGEVFEVFVAFGVGEAEADIFELSTDMSHL